MESLPFSFFVFCTSLATTINHVFSTSIYLYFFLSFFLIINFFFFSVFAIAGDHYKTTQSIKYIDILTDSLKFY